MTNKHPIAEFAKRYDVPELTAARMLRDKRAGKWPKLSESEIKWVDAYLKRHGFLPDDATPRKPK